MATPPPRLVRAPHPQFILLPIVLFVVIPAYIVAQDPRELSTFSPLGFVVLLATAVVVTLGLYALDRIGSRLPTRRPIALLVELTLFFVLITGFFLPATSGSGMEDPRERPIEIAHVAVALVVATVLVLIAATRLRRPMYVAVVAFLAVNAILTLPAIASLGHDSAAGRDEPAAPSIFVLSSDRNILVVSFDGLMGSVVWDVLQERPDLAARLKDFTFFSGAVSTSPATSASIATSLYGNRDYKQAYDSIEDLWASRPEDLLTNRLDEHGWTVSTYSEYGRQLHDPTRAFGALADRAPVGPRFLLNNGLARSLTSLAVIDGSVGDAVDRIYSAALGLLSGTSHEPGASFKAPHTPEWKAPLSSTVHDYLAYVDRLHVGRRDPVAHFLHFTHTHYPVELDRECRWAGQARDWYESHQDRDGLREQTHCALSQLADVVDRMTSMGVLDRSLIVLKSDHGEPVAYTDPASIESFRIRDHPLWGYGRYAPFLAIKGFGQRQERLSVDDHPVTLDDLPKTLCVHAGIDADCEEYGGYDLLGADWSGVEESLITLFIVESRESDHTYDTHEAITIARGPDVIRSMHRALASERLRSPLACGESISVDAGAPLDNGRSDGESWLTWRDGTASSLRFSFEVPCARSSLTLETTEGESVLVGLRIFVNGQAVALRTDDVLDASGRATLDISSGLSGLTGDIEIEVRLAEGAPISAVSIVSLTLG